MLVLSISSASLKKSVYGEFYTSNFKKSRGETGRIVAKVDNDDDRILLETK